MLTLEAVATCVKCGKKETVAVRIGRLHFAIGHDLQRIRPGQLGFATWDVAPEIPTGWHASFNEDGDVEMRCSDDRPKEEE